MKKIFLLLFIYCCTQCTVHGALLRDSIKHDGIWRTYWLYIPAVYNPNKPSPLVFNLHGLSSNGLEQIYYGNFMPIADTANFLIVAPDGTKLYGEQFWNVGGGIPSSVDDIGFLNSLIDSLSLKYNINPNRVYSTGMSNGGFMSYYLACHSNRFTAIASVTGSIFISELSKCSPSRPVPVMEIHGTADSTVQYNGSSLFEPIENVVNYWVGFNNCNQVPVITNVPDTSKKDSSNAVHYVYQGGTNGSTVEFFKVIKGAHTWPGSAINIGVTCQDFSACIEIWRFFRGYSLDRLVSANEYVKNDNKPLIYPNPSLGHVNIHTPDNELMDVSLYSLNGELILHSELIKTLELKSLQPNMYFIIINTSKKIYTDKIIVL